MFQNNINNAHSLEASLIQAHPHKWLDHANSLLSHLQQGQENEALLLLKQAYQLIERSEAKIKAQKSQIADLNRVSTTDELTGILNRRGFFAAFERELDRINRTDMPKDCVGGLLIMIDLDNFKLINDTYGHQAGDAALQLVAKTLQNDIRKMDLVARLGGDEFVLLFTNTDKSQATTRAQFLIKKLNNLSFIWKRQEIDVRASLGLKTYRKGAKAKHIFAAVDSNMYTDKQNKA